ncbi:hypothetical protein [Photobacterium sanguinicancri]|uniref:hypothetical protein n=1 Tax=Photobacterium sanguinicancri TaxID=875932 RepID=UPI0024810167|nr:hypothetical protein [Photobacterium sanguinicancri]
MLHNKFLIAKEHLQCAINLFLDGNYFSALTLAGASEEILAKFMKEYLSKEPAFRQIIPLINSKVFPEYDEKYVINKINTTKNAVKHPDNANREFEPAVTCHIKEEAMVLIVRALSNYRSFPECDSDNLANITEFYRIVDSDPLMHINVNASLM